MATLHPRIHQLLPDGEKILLLRAKHVDALSSGNLAVQIVLLGHLPDGDELVGRDLAAGHTRHDGESPVALDVGQESVIGVLQVVDGFVHEVGVKETRKDGCDGRLAYFAAQRLGILAAGLHHGLKGLELLDCDDVVEIDSRVWDVRADCSVVVNIESRRLPGEYSRWLETSCPMSFIVLLKMDCTRGMHPPQPVPALVQDLTWAIVLQEPLLTLSTISAFVTL